MADVFGRDDVLAAALATVQGAGPQHAVLLEGAAGIGKTAVLDAVIDTARAAGILVLETRPSEAEARVSLLGLHDLLAPVADRILGRLPAPQYEILAAALSLIEPARTADGGAARLSVATTASLRALSEAQRVVIAVDDSQWLDSSTAALLESALKRLRDADVRLVATRRLPEDRRRGRGLELPSGSGITVQRLMLEPLSPGALHAVIGAHLGLSLPRPTLLRLHAASDGNPLYAIELARSLGEDAPTRERLDASVPEDLKSLLWRRIRRLPSLAHDVLLVASLTAQPTPERLAAVLHATVEEIDRAVDAGVDAGLLATDSVGVRVAHPVIGAVARVRAAATTRRELHRRLAAIVEDSTEASVHRSLAAVGPDAEVAGALEAAALLSLRRGATTEAADLFHRSVRATPIADARHASRRRVSLAEALFVSGDTERAFRELRSLDVSHIADTRTKLDAILLLGVLQWFTGDPAEAIALHLDALASAATPSDRARLHMRLAWLYERDLERAREHAVAALELLDAETQPADYGFALLSRAGSELCLGISADHAAIARGAALQEGHDTWDISEVPVSWALSMDDWDGARTRIDRMIALAEQQEDETTIGHMHAYRAEVEAWSGHIATGLAEAAAALARAESTQQPTNVTSAKARRALILAAAGDLDAADAEGRSALEHAERLGSATLIAMALGARGSVARQREDYPETVRLLTRASDELTATGDVDQPAHRFHGDLLDALVAVGDLAGARGLIDRLDRRGRLGPRPGTLAIAERGRAQVALAENRLDEAAAHIARATALHDGSDAPLERARTQLVAAQLHRRAGRRKLADSQLRAALATLEAIGARGWAGRARDDLVRLGLRPGDEIELTPSEDRIARLAARGLRNREIASRLFISPKTVEASLGRAYAKLGVRSRTELANAIALTGAARESTDPLA